MNRAYAELYPPWFRPLAPGCSEHGLIRKARLRRLVGSPLRRGTPCQGEPVLDAFRHLRSTLPTRLDPLLRLPPSSTLRAVSQQTGSARLGTSCAKSPRDSKAVCFFSITGKQQRKQRCSTRVPRILQTNPVSTILSRSRLTHNCTGPYQGNWGLRSSHPLLHLSSLRHGHPFPGVPPGRRFAGAVYA